MGRKSITPFSNIATSISPYNLSWENTTHACLDRKYLIHPPIPAEVMHDLQKWSEDEVTIRRRTPESTVIQTPTNTANQQPQTTCVKNRQVLAIEKEKLNVRYKSVRQALVEPNIAKRIEQVATKTINLATKVYDPKMFEQRYKLSMAKCWIIYHTQKGYKQNKNNRD